MNGISIIILVALVFGLVGLAVLLWALRNGQHDDPDDDALRNLKDELPE